MFKIFGAIFKYKYKYREKVALNILLKIMVNHSELLIFKKLNI